MSGSRAAIRYAKAVLSLATDNKSADAVNSDMKLITSTMAQSEDLRQMLQSPVVRSADKKAVLTLVFKNANVATTNLIDTLISNKRLALLNDVAASYEETVIEADIYRRRLHRSRVERVDDDGSSIEMFADRSVAQNHEGDATAPLSFLNKRETHT